MTFIARSPCFRPPPEPSLREASLASPAGGGERNELGGTSSGGLHDRVDYLHVAGAAAEIAFDRALDLRARGLRMRVEPALRLHDHARRAETALHRALVDERLLEPLAERVAREALDRRQLAPFAVDGEHQARAHGLA